MHHILPKAKTSDELKRSFTGYLDDVLRRRLHVTYGLENQD